MKYFNTLTYDNRTTGRTHIAAEFKPFYPGAEKVGTEGYATALCGYSVHHHTTAVVTDKPNNAGLCATCARLAK